MRELPILMVAACAIALLIKAFLVQAFYIPSGSMLPTLRNGDRVLVEKVSYWMGTPDRGDVVVFEKELAGLEPTPDEEGSLLDRIGDSFRELFGFPTGSEQDFIKRVVAVEGDTVEGRNGLVYVNGRPVPEPYLPASTQTTPFGPLQVPQGEIFVMGDNRDDSDDSRNYGPIPVDSVIGHAFVLMWPPEDFRGL